MESGRLSSSRPVSKLPFRSVSDASAHVAWFSVGGHSLPGLSFRIQMFSDDVSSVCSSVSMLSLRVEFVLCVVYLRVVGVFV